MIRAKGFRWSSFAEQAETDETRQAVEGIKDSTKDLTKSGLEKVGEKWNYFKQGLTW